MFWAQCQSDVRWPPVDLRDKPPTTVSTGPKTGAQTGRAQTGRAQTGRAQTNVTFAMLFGTTLTRKKLHNIYTVWEKVARPWLMLGVTITDPNLMLGHGAHSNEPHFSYLPYRHRCCRFPRLAHHGGSNNRNGGSSTDRSLSLERIEPDACSWHYPACSGG